MSGSAQNTLANIRNMLQAQGLPITAENLNRAMLAQARGEQIGPVQSAQAGTSPVSRTMDRVMGGGNELPMPPPAQPEMADEPEAVQEAPAQEQAEYAQPQAAPVEAAPAQQPGYFERYGNEQYQKYNSMSWPEILLEGLRLGMMGIGGRGAGMPMRDLGVTVPQRMLPGPGASVAGRELPPAAGAGVPRLPAPTGGGSGGAQAQLPAPQQMLPAPAPAKLGPMQRGFARGPMGPNVPSSLRNTMRNRQRGAMPRASGKRTDDGS